MPDHKALIVDRQKVELEARPLPVFVFQPILTHEPGSSALPDEMAIIWCDGFVDRFFISL
jgi:hypothetical protein